MTMTTHLILQGGGMMQALERDVPAGGKLIDPVRELVRDGALPLYWRCGQGTCGACLVRLEHADSGCGSSVALGSKERNVLARVGVLSEAERAAPTLADTPELPRLACHVVLQPGWLKVRWG